MLIFTVNDIAGIVQIESKAATDHPVSYMEYRLVSNIRRTSIIRRPPDFGEFPARIFSDHQFSQNLQYKTHPEFWLLSVDCWQSAK